MVISDRTGGWVDRPMFRVYKVVDYTSIHSRVQQTERCGKHFS